LEDFLCLDFTHIQPIFPNLFPQKCHSMLIRLVKMTFQPDQVQNFLALFRERRENIRHFPGCSYLRLLQADDTTFFTISHWESEHALETYRSSPFFQDTWASTKRLFAGPPEAWSTVEVVENENV
jgi:quinol monooxygenase YgiN